MLSHVLLCYKIRPLELFPQTGEDSISRNNKKPAVKTIDLPQFLPCSPDPHKNILRQLLRLGCRAQPEQSMSIDVLPMDMDQIRKSPLISTCDPIQYGRLIICVFPLQLVSEDKKRTIKLSI